MRRVEHEEVEAGRVRGEEARGLALEVRVFVDGLRAAQRVDDARIPGTSVRIVTPSRASAGGSAATTSPRPPVLTSG